MHGGTDETGDTSWWDLFWKNLHMKKNIFDGVIDKYNAFTDTPIVDLEFLKVMIEQYPNAYYIYTKRNHRDRYKSARANAIKFKDGRLKSPKIWIKEQEEKQLYIESVLKKNLHLKVLEFNVSDEGHGWKELCGFLNKEIPDSKELIKKVEWNGKKYGFIPNLSEITMGEYVDIEDYCKNGQKNLHKIMSILYRPIVKETKTRYEKTSWTRS